MSSAFEQFINGPDGPDVEFKGVTRTDGQRKARGDRDDWTEAKSAAKLRDRLDGLNAAHRKAVIDSGYGQVQEGKKVDYRGEQRKRDHAAIRQAVIDARSEPALDRDPMGGTPSGYVAPHERYTDNTVFLAVCVALLVILAIAGG